MIDTVYMIYLRYDRFNIIGMYDIYMYIYNTFNIYDHINIHQISDCKILWFMIWYLQDDLYTTSIWYMYTVWWSYICIYSIYAYKAF